MKSKGEVGDLTKDKGIKWLEEHVEEAAKGVNQAVEDMLEKRKHQTVHLILKHRYYNQINSGEKTVEYRDKTAYWKKRILDKNYVTFHRGFTNTTMTFEIAFKTLTETQIEIHLGERIA